MLNGLGRTVDAVLLFDIAEDELVRRLSGRTTCEACQKPFFGRQPGETCTEIPPDGGKLVRRADDEPEAVRKRLQVYAEQTRPVVEWYTQHGGRLVHIDALGSLDEVEARAIAALDELRNRK
jgi:adenylate kinase